MWKSKRQKAAGSGQEALRTFVAASTSPFLRITASLRRLVSSLLRVTASLRLRVSLPCFLLSAYCLLFAVGCRQDMQDQPKMKAFRSTTFFPDGLSSRTPVTGTVPRGYLRADREFFTGKKISAPTIVGTNTPVPGVAPAPNATATYPDDVEVFPLPVTQELITRGKERYEIYCSVCHGMTGNGDGMIVRRGYRRAASFHADNVRQAPVGHYFDAITNGWGAMPSYAPQITPRDRWAIVAYIRALQLSRQSAAATGGQSEPAAAPPAATPTGGHH